MIIVDLGDNMDKMSTKEKMRYLDLLKEEFEEFHLKEISYLRSISIILLIIEIIICFRVY